MFEVREGVTCVNGEVFQTFERDAREASACLEVEAGTTGFKGGDRKSGSRAYVRITAEEADFFARITDESQKFPRGAVIAVCGDDEIVALVKALEFAAEVLKDQLMEVED